MQKASLIIAFLLSFIGINTEVKATHAAGGELIYKWVSGSTYHITFKFYRDCSGTALQPNPAIICAYNTCTGQILTANVPPPQFYPGTNIPNGSPVSVGCAGVGTACNGGSLPGYQEWWYECDFTLPTQCANWMFYTSVAARNNAIVNLGPAPGGLYMFVYATLNNLVAQGNSSPFFTVKPVPYTCVNVPFVYNNGAVDIDGDSLTFELVNPLTGPTTCVVPTTTIIPYAPNSGPNIFNNTNNPFSTNNTFSLSTYTGQMSFTPNVISTDVVTVKVHEYRNGVEIGTIIRDIQLNIRPCNVPAPNVQLDTSSIVGEYINGQLEVCVGKPIHFCFEANTLPGRILVVSDNHSYISNNISVSYTNQGTDTVTGCFDWIPNITDTGVHIFVVVVKDSTCDLSGITVTNVLTIPIRVWPGVNIAVQGDSVICLGEQTTLFASGGVTGYQWTVLPGGSGPGSISCTNCATAVVSPTVTTSYSVHSTSLYGCPDTSMITIQVAPVPVAQAGNDIIVCAAVPVQLQGSGGGTYHWYPGTNLNNANIANPVFTGSGTSTLNLVVTNQFGCSDTDQVVVSVNPQPIANAGPDILNCTNGVVQLNGSGGTTYSWTPASLLNNSTIYNPTMTVGDTTITFTLVVMNGLGCSDTDQVHVSVHNAIANANAGTDINACIGNAIQLQGTGNGSFNWIGNVSNPSINNPFYTGNTTATLTLIVTDVFGCSDTDQVVVAVNPVPVANAGPDILNCSNGVVQLNGSGGTTYSWTPASVLNNSTIYNPTMTVGDTTITFTLVVMNGFGCSDTDQVNVSVHNAIAQANAGTDIAACMGNAIQLQGTGNGSFNWIGNVSNPSINNPFYTGNTTTTLTLIITDMYGCSDTDQVLVTVSPVPLANAGSDILNCSNGVVQLNGSGGTTCSWTPASVLNNSTIYNPSMTVADTTITFTLVVTNSFGCSDTDQVNVSVHNAIAQSDAGTDIAACIGDVVQLQGTGNGSLNWTGNVSNLSISNPFYTGNTTATLTLIVTDIYGCTDTDDVQVTIFPQPIAIAGPDSSLCSNAVVTLYASGGVNYNWFPTTNMTGANTATPTVTVSENIVYYAIVTDTSGCSDTATVSLSIISPPAFSVSPAQELCKSDSITLHASGGNDYQWYPDTYISSISGDEVTVWPMETMTYYVTITEPVCNYKDSLEVQVNVHELPEVKITRADPVRCGVSGQMEATGALNYSWSPAAMLDNSNVSNPISHVSTETWYYVTGTDQLGCENSDSVLMRIVADDPGNVFVPTAFSPNGDGKNDRYHIVQSPGITDFELHIYNRFGDNVYNADDASDSWDGSYKGKRCDVGVYYYYFKYKTVTCGKTIEGKGDITLLR
jgi:gliding motility-associated-like protein